MNKNRNMKKTNDRTISYLYFKKEIIFSYNCIKSNIQVYNYIEREKHIFHRKISFYRYL